MSGACARPFLFGVDFEMTKGFFVENPLYQKDIIFNFKGEGNYSSLSVTNPTVYPEMQAFPLPFDVYCKKFMRVHDGILRGDSFLTNLTMRTPIELNCSLEDIFCHSRAQYCILVPGHFVCFSPERFVLIDQGTVSTNPMKGTISTDIQNAEAKILSDKKETAEHYTIVDLLRNDISTIAENVELKRFRYIEQLNTSKGNLLQVSSEIVGSLSSGYMSRLGDLLLGILPAGSVSGAPKPATLKLIAEAERQERGFYTGVCGYFDGSRLDVAVMIRFIGIHNNQFYYASGGGITSMSKAMDEYLELIDKVYLPL